MDRTLRADLLHPRHLLATLAVVVLAGGGLAAAGAANSATLVPAAAQEPFGVPLPHEGDHGVYVYVGPVAGVPEDGRAGGPGDGFPTRVEFQWLADGEGFNATEARVLVNRLLAHVEAPGSDPTRREARLLPGTATEVFSSSFSEARTTPGFLPLGNTTYATTLRGWALHESDGMLWCGLRNPLQGARIDLARGAPDPLPCVGGTRGRGAPGATIVGTGVAGAAPDRTAVLETRFPGHGQTATRMTFQEQVPYPVALEFLSGETAAYRLESFARGAAPIANAPRVLAPAPAQPPLAPRQVWGPDESGVAHPFPLSAAFEAARNDGSFGDLRGFLAAHPRAYVGKASYGEIDFEGRLDRTWSFAVTDGTAHLGVSVQRSTAAATDPLGLRAASTTQVVRDDEVVRDAAFPSPDDAPPQLPTVRGLQQAWVAFSGRPVADANAWGFDLTCDAGPACATSGFVGAGRIEDAAIGFPVEPLYRRDVQFTVLAADVRGRLLDYAEVGMVQAGSFAPLVGAAPPGAAPASPHLAAVAAPWSLTPEAVAAAGLGALLVGLTYWLWPALKAGGVGLFSRVRTDDLLENPVRATLHQAIEAQPGIHQQDLVRLVGKGNGAVEHHLGKLVAAGLVVRVAGQGYTCYFLKGAADRHAMAAAPVLKSPVAQAIVAAARSRPGLSPAALARELGVTPPTVSYHLRRLEAAGLVRLEDGLRVAADA